MKEAISPGIIRAAPGTPCAGGFRLGLPSDYPVMCTHGPDPVPAGKAAAAAPPGDGIICDGDGVTGPRVQLIYAPVAGRTNDATVTQRLQTDAAHVDAVIRASAVDETNTRRVRFVHDDSCRPTVLSVPVSAAAEADFAAMVKELLDRGLARPDRKYLVYVDAATYCGIATVYFDSSPAQTNANNGRFPQFARVDRPCWGVVGTPTVTPAAHELLHTLGAVQSDAPHATVANHCTDSYDVMCYKDDVTTVLVARCPVTHADRADCGHDDYFSTAPVPGSYLSTHWNVADSAFLVGERRADSAPAKPVERIAGEDRIATAAAISNATWGARDAAAAVLARADAAPDALAGTPLAVSVRGPLLLTPSGTLDQRVAVELQRAVPAGATVHLLGGADALSPAVEVSVRGLGYRTVRHAGTNRYETAAIIAEQGLPGATAILLADGHGYADALVAGAAAPRAGGAVLLTAGATMPTATRSYVERHGASRRYAIGGMAAAADPTATMIAGRTRYETASLVADTLGGAVSGIALASGANFPDALAGGAHAVAARSAVLLSDPALLPDATRAWVDRRRTELTVGFVYGGPAAISDAVLAELRSALQ